MNKNSNGKVQMARKTRVQTKNLTNLTIADNYSNHTDLCAF